MANEVETQTLNYFVMAVRHFIEGIRAKDADPGKMIAALFFLGLGLLFTGAEAMKIVFRRDFAKDTVGIVQIIIASLIFIGCGVAGLIPAIAMTIGNVEDAGSYFESPLSFAITGLFYLMLGIWIFIKGLREWNLSLENEEGTALGESTFLGFLKDSGWSEFKISQRAEPLTVLALGILLSGINIFMGIPLLFCAVTLYIFSLISYKKQIENAPLRSKLGGKSSRSQGTPQ
jgi:protein-S-isoprenylcysteine O-methyltransferase Ste14